MHIIKNVRILYPTAGTEPALAAKPAHDTEVVKKERELLSHTVINYYDNNQSVEAALVISILHLDEAAPTKVITAHQYRL